jgi:hypothetical protein
MNTTSAYDYLRARLHGRLAASDKAVLDPAEISNLVENEV